MFLKLTLSYRLPKRRVDRAMLKRLFVFIFILQSFALTATAGMTTTNLNPAEKIQMQLMHTQVNDKQHKMMDCDQCNGQCQDLLCSSIHVTSNFILSSTQPITQSTLVQIVPNDLNSLVVTQFSQPETPPPSI